MSEDYRVNKRSNQEVRALAERAKKFYRVDKHRPVNVVRCLQSGWVETEQGRKTLRYEIRSDEEMGADDARTEFTSHTVVISVRSSVHNAALFGDGRARMTLAHELGHAVMHFGAPKSRRMGASGATAVAQINASESAEHQAKVFGPAFLIHEEGARDLAGPEEISVEFGVSLTAATISYERLVEEAERARAIERVERHNEAFKASTPKSASEMTYAEDCCSQCKEATLIPIGIKFVCHSCGFVGDQFQDGDKAA